TGGRGMAAAVCAVLLVVASIAIGKFAILYVDASQAHGPKPFRVESEDVMIGTLADVVKNEFKQEQRRVTPAARPDAVGATLVEQYSPEVWAEAKARWEALSEQEQAQQTAEHEQRVNEIAATFNAGQREQARARAWKEATDSFVDSFQPLDGLW